MADIRGTPYITYSKPFSSTYSIASDHNIKNLTYNFRFWRGMYCRYESGVHPREPLGDLLLATCDHSFSLDDHIKYLTKVKHIFRNKDFLNLTQTV